MSDYGVFLDTLAKTPEFRPDRGQAVRDVYDEYRDFKDFNIRGMTLEEAERRGKKVERFENVVSLGETLADMTNSRNAKEVAKGLFIGVSRQHRTLQAQAVSAMIEFLKLYRENSFDGRNRVAVVAADRISQLVDEENIYIPLI